jgi:hypothetical protein
MARPCIILLIILFFAGYTTVSLSSPADIVAVIKAYEYTANTRDTTAFRKHLALNDARFREIEDHIPAPFGSTVAGKPAVTDDRIRSLVIQGRTAPAHESGLRHARHHSCV